MSPSVNRALMVNSIVRGKINEKSLSGVEYFLSFIDDKTHYVWVYFLKQKNQIFEKFVEWKKLVEKESGETLKILHTDNGGEFTSSEFEAYLKTERVSHTKDSRTKWYCRAYEQNSSCCSFNVVRFSFASQILG